MTLNFIKRNLPIFIIGGLTVVVFIGIIIVSRAKSPDGLNLEQVELETLTTENEVAESTESLMMGNTEPETGLIAEETTPEEATSLIDKLKKSGHIITAEDYLPIKIAFTEGGFVPKVASGYEGQQVIWTNKTDKTLKMIQLRDFFDEIGDGIELAPGATFSVTLIGEGTWKYREMDNYYLGTIEISKP